MSNQASNRKRRASTAGMGPPDKQSMTKKTKLDTALETRLTELKQVLHPDELSQPWKVYDPGDFMDEMRRIGRKINALTLDTVGNYITNGSLEANLSALDIQDIELRRPVDPESVKAEYLEFAQRIRQQMINYVERVWTGLNVLFDQANVKPSPNEFADKKGTIAYFPYAYGLPRLTRYLHDPLLDEQYLSMADELCEEMPSAFDSEIRRRDDFEKIFGSLDITLRQHTKFSLLAEVSTSGARADVAKTMDCEGGDLVLLLEEFKMESTGDVYMQICRSYEVLCEGTRNKRLLNFGYPVFLLCVLGPYLMVCGAIKHKNAHVEPLTPLLPMFPGFGIEGRPAQITHCLRALKQGLDSLKEFWHNVGVFEAPNKNATTDGLPDPYLVSDCPDNALLRFDDWRGTFENPMPDRSDTDKPPRFLARIYKAGNERQYPVVVKFVYSYSGTYGTDVHKYLQGLKLAPILHSAENLDRGLIMVVMERLAFKEGSGGWVELDTFEGKLDTRKAGAVRRKLESIIKLLQKSKMVHADLRPTNVMIKVDGKGHIILSKGVPILSVIDFDWAGTVGEACYPPFLNRKVPWPEGAKAYQKVGEDDDRILLNNWWDAFVKGQSTK